MRWRNESDYVSTSVGFESVFDGYDVSYNRRSIE